MIRRTRPEAVRFVRRMWPVLLALIIGLVLVATKITSSYWIDELYTVEHYAKLTGILIDPHPPLYALIIAGWGALFGTSEIALRSLSVIFWLAAAAIVSTKSRVAAVLVLVSPLMIENATNARMYAMLAFATSLIAVGLVRTLETKRGAMLAAGVLIAAFTHLYGAIIGAAAYGVLTLVERKIRIEAVVLGAIIAGWYAFQYLFIETNRIGWLHVTIDTLRALAAPLGLSIAALVLVWIAIGYLSWKRDTTTRALLAVVLATFGIAAAVTFTIQPILHPRYTAALVPIVGLLIGRLNDTKAAALIMIAVLLALTPLSTTTIYPQDYRSIGELVDASEDPIVISFARQQGHYTNGSVICEHEDCVQAHIEGYATVWIIDGIGSMPETMLTPLENWSETRHDIERLDVRSYTR